MKQRVTLEEITPSLRQKDIELITNLKEGYSAVCFTTDGFQVMSTKGSLGLTIGVSNGIVNDVINLLNN